MIMPLEEIPLMSTMPGLGVEPAVPPIGPSAGGGASGNAMLKKKRPSLLGSSRQMSRSSPEPPVHGILKQRKWSVGSAGEILLKVP